MKAKHPESNKEKSKPLREYLNTLLYLFNLLKTYTNTGKSFFGNYENLRYLEPDWPERMATNNNLFTDARK